MRQADVEIDRMAEDDVPDVLALEAIAFPPSDAPGAPPVDHGRVGETQLREELARPWARLWVARDVARNSARGAAPEAPPRARAIAFLLAWHVVDELHVLNVATHPEHRRRGVASRLLEHALAFARAHQGRLLLLEVRRSNAPAIALYRRLGFFAMGLRRNYYSDGEDAIEMALLLDPATGALLPQADEVKLGD